MGACSYENIREDLRHVADELKNNGIEYKAYNSGIQFNAMDANGVIHSFYPTKGTVILNASNDPYDHRKKVFRNQSLDAFIAGMKSKNLTRFYFEED